MRIEDFYSSIVRGGLVSGNRLSTGAITKETIQSVYGSPEEFLERYSSFQDKYIKLLKNGKVDSSKVGRVNIDALIAGGKIDLSILDEESAKLMRSEYSENILRLPQLFKQTGLPSQELPSTNLYRKAMRYSIDAGEGAHPIEVLLNRTIFNVNPKIAGIEAFNPGSANIIGLSSLKQAINPVDLTGKKVFTFDVETTGVFEGSQVRSMSIAENVDGNIRLLDDFNFTYKSRQLGGVTVGGSESLADFLSRAKGTKNIADSKGGRDFLDQSAKFINKLLEADHVAGHNIMFDIQALANTMQQMGDFNSHKEAREALEKLYKKMQAGDNFVIDTLEQSRMYLSKQVNALLDSGAVAIDDSARLENFKRLMYSPEFLARAKMGQSAATASVEAIAMNTNLLELIEKEAQAGDSTAANLFERIYRGTHVSDTDAILQSYVQKYINEGIREERDPFALRIVDQKTRLDYSELVRGAQSAIFKSGAITPTTNIADMTHLSETVRKAVASDALIDRVTVTSTLEELMQKGLISRSDLSATVSEEALKTKGILAFDKRTNQNVFRVEAGESVFRAGEENRIVIERTASRKYLREILDQSLMEATDEVVIPGPIGSIGHPVKINKSAQKIVDLGLSYMQASQIDEVEHIAKHATRLTELTAETGAIDEKRLLASMGKTYEKLSVGTPIFKAMRGEAEFTPGLNNATARTALELANAAIDIGSPHVVMSNQGRMFSTILSQATSGELERAREAALVRSSDATLPESVRQKAAAEANELRYARHKDLMSEYGVSHFKLGRKIDVVRATSEKGAEMIPSRLFMPIEVIQEAVAHGKLQEARELAERTGTSLADTAADDASKAAQEIIERSKFNVSLAQTREGKKLNLFLNFAEGDDTEKISGYIYQFLMDDKSKIVKTDKAVEARLTEQLTQARQSLKSIQDIGEVKPEDFIKFFGEAIEEGGLGVGYIEGKGVEQFIRATRASGIQIDNDFFMKMMSGRFAGQFEDSIRITGMEDENVIRGSAAAAQDAVNASAKIRNDGLGKLSDIISALPQSVQRILKMRQRRRMMGMQANDFIEKIIENKGSLKAAAIGIGASIAGYYMYKKSRENNIYDETLEQQPVEQYGGRLSSNEPTAQPMNSFRRDPLVTAGVVGNLDRNRIGHHRMGNDKYNHLYSGV